MEAPSKQLDLFASEEPEIKGMLVAFALLLRGLLEALLANGLLTKEQAITLLRETDVRAAFAVWDELQGQMPDSEWKNKQPGFSIVCDGKSPDRQVCKIFF